MYTNENIVELYESLDKEDKLFVDGEMMKYFGHAQRSMSEKLRAKRPYYSRAEKDSYEAKFKDIYNQLNNVLI
jgi:hypothetical protein